MIYKLFYDAECPVCKSFARLLSKKLDSSKIRMVPLRDDASDFKLQTPNGQVVVGKKALDLLIVKFPEVKSYFWMLPSSLQTGAIKATVSVAKVIRSAIGPRKPCNCCNKKSK